MPAFEAGAASAARFEADQARCRGQAALAAESASAHAQPYESGGTTREAAGALGAGLAEHIETNRAFSRCMRGAGYRRARGVAR
jgi:hypothetical protein